MPGGTFGLKLKKYIKYETNKMHCKHYQKALYLYRKNELTNRQQKKLDHHIAKCPYCSRIKQKLEIMDTIAVKIRKSEPNFSDPDKITDNVLAEIYTSAPDVPLTRSDKISDNLLNFISLPKVRLALLVFGIMIITTFFLQEFMILSKISNLEKKLALHSENRHLEENILFKKSFLFSDMHNMDQLKNLQDFINAYSEFSNGWSIIKISRLESLIRSYKNILQENKLLLKDLEKRNPIFHSLLMNPEINASDIKNLLKNKMDIIKFTKDL